MAKKHKRRWNFKRSRNEDRSFFEWCGARREPHVTEGMSHVEELVKELIDDIGLREGVTLDHLSDTWANLIGSNIANNSEPLEIRDGVLRIRVTQPVIKFELTQRQALILKRVQEKLPEAKIRKIEVVI